MWEVRPALRAALGTPMVAGALAGSMAVVVPGALFVRVSWGDTLSGIARRHHTTVSALVALNRLPGNGDRILAGQRLQLPATRAGSRPGRAATGSTRSYVVRPGDTVSGIAAAAATSTVWLRSHNRLGPRCTILVGQRLRLPGRPRTNRATRLAGAAVPGSFAGRTYPAAVTAAAERHRLALRRRPAPSPAAVRRLVAATARRYALDPALALAVATQESGFRQRVVSPADAVGTMQVLPATTAYVARYLVHRPLDPLRARDNVTAGVALLAQLRRAAPLPTAVAGYYQGLGSVRAKGMYPDTKAYVASVLALRERYAAPGSRPR